MIVAGQRQPILIATRPVDFRCGHRALGANVSIRQKLSLAACLRPPLVQRRFGNPFLLRQLPNGHCVRRQHPLQHSRFSFR
jgi:hypothetical protein